MLRCGMGRTGGAGACIGSEELLSASSWIDFMFGLKFALWKLGGSSTLVIMG